MSETDEEKRKRWAKSKAMSYMTPAMQHAMAMSKCQSQNKYKEQFNKTKGKGYTAVASTPELERVKQQTARQSQSKYKSEFEKNKAKFTQVADDPETLRVRKVTNQVSKIAYEGKGAALAQSKSRKPRTTTTQREATKAEPVNEDKQSPEEPSYGRPAEEDGEETKVEQIDSYKEQNVESSEAHSEYENNAEVPRETHDDYENNSGIPQETHSDYEDTPEVQETHEEETEEYTEDVPPTEDYNPTQENGDVKVEAEYEYQETSQREEEEELPGGREYVEADADEEELKEIEEGGLDDFYANLG